MPTYLEHAAKNELFEKAGLPKLGAFLKASFADRIGGTYKRTDGTTFDWENDALPVADTSLVLTIDNLSIRDDDEYRGQIEIRAYDKSKNQGRDSVGGYVTVYGPEITYGYTLKPAYVSWSSGTAESSDVLDAYSQALRFASMIVDLWTEEDTPRLEANLAKRIEEREASRAQAAAERDAAQLKFKQLPSVGSFVRVAVTGKKTPVVGELTELRPDGLQFDVKVPWREEPFTFGIRSVESMERKNPVTNRYQEVQF